MTGPAARLPSVVRSLFIFLCSLILSLTLTASPSAGAKKLKKFEEVTRVVEVQVPVNVVTRGGEPVRGLTAEDFEIYDGKRRREIVDFSVVDLQVLEPGSSRSEIEAAVPAAARRRFLLLFDLSFSSPNLIIRAREAARDFVLNHLHPTDLAAVAIHSVDSGGRILVTFTPDRAQVARAIDTLGAPRLVGLARRDPLFFLIDDPNSSAFSASTDVTDLNNTGPESDLQQSVSAHIRIVAKQMARMERSFIRGRISSWSRSMADLARFMDSVRGRKHVLYFSEGFDGRLLLGRQPSADDQELQQDLVDIQLGQLGFVDTDDIYGNSGLQSEVAQMLEEFRRADCVIQAIDISGLRADSEAEERARSVGQDALFYIANDTGGVLFQDATDFGEDLSQVLQRSSVTYLLTFQASDVVPDGSYHRIHVKAKLDRRAKLTYRRGYYAPRPFEELHPLEKSLLASDVIANASRRDDLTLNVLAAPFRASSDQAYVPIIIEVAGEQLLVGHEGAQMPVELYTYVTDERGEMKDFLSHLVTLDLSRGRSAFAKTGLKYYGHMELRPGEYLIRVLVRNALTGRTGSESTPLSIPSFELSEPYLLPPFFLEGERQWFLVREKSQGYESSVIYPFTVNGNPYIPSALPSLRSSDEAQICLVAYNLGDGNVEIGSRILAENGEPVNGGQLALVERTVTGIDGLDKLLATFRPQGLEAGRYTLEVDVMHPASGSMETNSIGFTVFN